MLAFQDLGSILAFDISGQNLFSAFIYGDWIIGGNSGYQIDYNQLKWRFF